MAKPYQPKDKVAEVLGSIQSLLTHPKTHTVKDSFNGKTFMCVLPGGQLYFDSVLEVDTDGSVFAGQDKTGAKGTSATDDKGKSLDADKINYFVLPEGGFEDKYKIKKGDFGVVISGAVKAFACFGDRGQAGNLGEGSLSLHRALGHERVFGKRFINAGIDAGVVTIVFPGSGNGSGRSNDESKANGDRLFQKLKADAFAYEMELLSRYKSRQIVITSNRDDLEARLSDWMQEVLDHTPPAPGADGDGEDLVAAATGIETLLYAPASMQLPEGRNPASPSRTVYADFKLGRTAAGRWFVEKVAFHLSPQDQAAAEVAKLKASY